MRTTTKRDRLDLVLPADLRVAVEELARQYDRSVSGQVRVALREHVERARANQRKAATR